MDGDIERDRDRDRWTEIVRDGDRLMQIDRGRYRDR
jgi:hypothetical protein